MKFQDPQKRHTTDWKSVYEGVPHGDVTRFHEDRALASVQLGGPCSSHEAEVFCLECLPRLEAAVRAARRALDPQAKPLIKEIEVQEEQPPYLALVNHMSLSAYAMRLDCPRRVTAFKSLYTSTEKGERFSGPIPLLSYKVGAGVTDAAYMRGFYVRLGEGVPEEYTKRLWEAKLSLRIDEEPMVIDRPLREILSQKETLLARPIPGRSVLFTAAPLSPEKLEKAKEAFGKPGKSFDIEVNEDEWIGYMLPNGTDIECTLDRVPTGGGLIELEIGWILGIYTTRAYPRERSYEKA